MLIRHSSNLVASYISTLPIPCNDYSCTTCGGFSYFYKHLCAHFPDRLVIIDGFKQLTGKELANLIVHGFGISMYLGMHGQIQNQILSDSERSEIIDSWLARSSIDSLFANGLLRLIGKYQLTVKPEIISNIVSHALPELLINKEARTEFLESFSTPRNRSGRGFENALRLGHFDIPQELKDSLRLDFVDDKTITSIGLSGEELYLSRFKPKILPVPTPSSWLEVHAALNRSWYEAKDHDIPTPPPPLVLAASAFVCPTEIRRQWNELVRWATTYEFLEILESCLPPPLDVDMAEKIAGISDDLWCEIFGGRGKPRAWYEYGEQFHDPKIAPPKELVFETLNKLKFNWAEIVGHDIAAHTTPLRFTGRKFRKLVVITDNQISPPWGESWFSTDYPRAFTVFRYLINSEISPLEVDQIDFVERSVRVVS